MNHKNIYPGWFIAGALFLGYSAFVKVTGTYILDGDSLSLFTRKAYDPVLYYIHLMGSASIGVLLLYRSLLFIPSNRTFYDNYPKYLSRRMEDQRSELRVNPARLLKVIAFIVLLFLIIMVIAKVL